MEPTTGPSPPPHDPHSFPGHDHQVFSALGPPRASQTPTPPDSDSGLARSAQPLRTPTHINRCWLGNFPQRTPLPGLQTLTFLERIVLKCHHCRVGGLKDPPSRLQQTSARRTAADQPKLARNVAQHVTGAAACGPIGEEALCNLPVAAGSSLSQSLGEPGLSDGEAARVLGRTGWARRGWRQVSRVGRELLLRGQTVRFLLFQGHRAGQAQLSLFSSSRTA